MAKCQNQADLLFATNTPINKMLPEGYKWNLLFTLVFIKWRLIIDSVSRFIGSIDFCRSITEALSVLLLYFSVKRLLIEPRRKPGIPVPQPWTELKCWILKRVDDNLVFKLPRVWLFFEISRLINTFVILGTLRNIICNVRRSSLLISLYVFTFLFSGDIILVLRVRCRAYWGCVIL